MSISLPMHKVRKVFLSSFSYIEDFLYFVFRMTFDFYGRRWWRTLLSFKRGFMIWGKKYFIEYRMDLFPCFWYVQLVRRFADFFQNCKRTIAFIGEFLCWTKWFLI